MSIEEAEIRERISERIDLHVHFHFDRPIKIELVRQDTPPKRRQATHAIISIGGSMATTSPPGAQVSIDDANAQVVVEWVDDKGDTNAAPPEGIVVNYVVDNPAVATVDGAGKLTPVAEGAANVSVSFTNQSGAPYTLPDGSAFPQPDLAPFEVVAGAAVGAELAVKS